MGGGGVGDQCCFPSVLLAGWRENFHPALGGCLLPAWCGGQKMEKARESHSSFAWETVRATANPWLPLWSGGQFLLPSGEVGRGRVEVFSPLSC